MSDWREPITDRTLQDVKNVDVGSLEYQKGALNADDLNRIEDNYKYLMAKLRSDAIFIPHRLRNFTETVLEYVQTGEEAPEYTVVEYLESTGEQCIDTGVVADQSTRILIDFEVSPGHSGEGHICSARTGSGTPLVTLFYKDASYSVRYGTSAVTSVSGISGAGRHLFDRNKNVLTVDETYTITSNYAEFTVGSTLPLFCRNDNNGSYNTFISGKLYSCKIWDNDVLIRDYIPVLDEDGIPCLYDKVNRKLYYNSHTGVFKYPVDLPEGYTQVEYIQSSGTQYIDTGYKVNSNLRIVMDAQFTSANANQSFFGGRTSGSSLDAMWIGWNGSNIFADYTNYYRLNYSASPTNRITLEMNKNVCTVNGETQTFTAHTFTSNYTLALFALNNAGAFIQPSSMKLYSCQIYDNGILVRDFVPCTNASGEAGLYDFVNAMFYANKGSGMFVTGDEVKYEKPESPTEPEVTYEILEVKTVYTDWREHNLPWLSEINRIRANYNALVRLFLVGLGFSEQKESNYLDYIEVNNWERFALVGKTMFENMEKEYRYCGVEVSGGDRLL